MPGEQLLIQEVGDVHVIEFTDARIVDQSHIDAIRTKIMSLVDEKDKPRLLMSFENVRQISSAGLGMLIMLSKAARRKEGEVRLCSFAPAVREVITLTGIDKLMKVHANMDDALAQFI